MVTLITEKLQNQSLDDLARKSCGAGPCSAEKLSRSGRLFPVETSEDRCPWKAVSGGRAGGAREAAGPPFPFRPSPCGPAAGLGAVSAVDLRDSSGPPSAPPTKRHCRSLSEPDELARSRSPWRPGGSKVWTLVSKRRCHSGGSASLPGTTEPPGRAFPAAGPTSPPAPRPASASGGFVDSSRAGAGPPWGPVGPCAPSSRRRLSLSQERLASAGTVPCTPEPGRPLGLPRSRSQPCVLLGRKSRLKRPREDAARWPRPSLDFLKMTRTLKNSKSLCSLDYEDDEDDTGVKTAVSSPCDPHGLTGLLTPRPRATSPSPSCGDPSDGDSAGEEALLPLDHGELDLEQIENN